jgi:hypothetical protein
VATPLDGTPLSALSHRVQTLSGQRLGGYPCLQVKAEVKEVKGRGGGSKSSAALKQAERRAAAGEAANAGLQADNTRLQEKVDYLVAALEKAEDDEDALPANMLTARCPPHPLAHASTRTRADSSVLLRSVGRRLRSWRKTSRGRHGRGKPKTS